jgi:hypothetical protein
MNAWGTYEYIVKYQGELEENTLDFDLTSKWLDGDKNKLMYNLDVWHVMVMILGSKEW